MFFANVKLFALAFVIRSVGCTWNDIVDRELDRKVARCRNRPMARGALSLTAAYIFTAYQYLILYTFLGCFSPQCLPYIPPLIAMGIFYPFAKRITSYAQIVLGFTLSWGTLVGCVMMKVFPLELGLSPSAMGLLALSLAYVFWTITYDTIYAFQDIKDDTHAGIMSMAIRHKNHIKPSLFVMSLIQTGFLVLTGVMISAGPAFYTGVVGTAALLVQMVAAVDVGKPSSCWWWFKYGALLVGGSEFLSLLGEYLKRL
ncbi:Para-hydroxybenzoate--polyprenyltransferase, mitochondrial precursor (PHB:polyprenyltransferase) [Xylographa trunciseda]|nr:Para-hydroxybenzoate--polyprenyltransferase, mitochondrial precursor (PHB:polyprenyltransferase) [Xylographa trunciseda]